ncbi:MAG: hypothetical protein M1587_04840 [Thaumarchaeota archaeon]|nr:hypothetical protein [Nitrososphaerota archaeon]
MKAKEKEGLIALSSAAVILAIVSILLASQSSQIVTWYYSVTPPMKNCGMLPHDEPNYLSSQLDQIKTDPTFERLENGSLFQYSTNSQMVEKYYNGAEISILEINFVHLISNSKESVIYVQLFQNGTETFRLQSFNVVCLEPGGSRVSISPLSEQRLV